MGRRRSMRLWTEFVSTLRYSAMSRGIAERTKSRTPNDPASGFAGRVDSLSNPEPALASNDRTLAFFSVFVTVYLPGPDCHNTIMSPNILQVGDVPCDTPICRTQPPPVHPEERHTEGSDHPAQLSELRRLGEGDEGCPREEGSVRD